MSTFSALTLLTALITPGFAAEGACKAGNEPECFAKSGTDGVGMVQRRVNISKHEEASEIPPVALLNGNYTRNADAAQQASKANCDGFYYPGYQNTLTLTAVVEIDGARPEGTLMAFVAGVCAGLFPNPEAPGQGNGWATLMKMPPFSRCCAGAPMYGMTLYTNFPGWAAYSFKFQASDGTMSDLAIKAGGYIPLYAGPGSTQIWMEPEENYGNAMLPIIFEKV